MKSRAALAVQAGKPLEITDVNLEGPKDGEILVEIMATGVCHTDEFTLSGADPEGIFPAILGHEGAGIVREIGSGVTSLKKGDHVIPYILQNVENVIIACIRRPTFAKLLEKHKVKGSCPTGLVDSLLWMVILFFITWEHLLFQILQSCLK